MNRQLFALSMGLLVFGVAAQPLLAQETSKAAVELRIEAQQRRANAAAEKRAAIDVAAEAAAYNATVSTFRYETVNGPSPLFVNPGDSMGTLLPPNAVYAQSQVGTFGASTAEWLALGNSPFPGGATSPYGLRLNWDSALGVLNLVDKGIAGQKDLVIGFGGSTGDLLKFNFFPTVTSSTATTVASISPTGIVRNLSGVRSGSETGTSQPPSVGTTTGYVGLISRRINSTSTAAGQILARTDFLTLERDGFNGGLRINYPVPTLGNQNVACTAVTSIGVVMGKAFNLIAPSITQLYTNADNIVSVNCTFGDSYLLNNITQVYLQRFPGDNYFAGTVTSTFNQ
jgi:hypothetical protein